MEELIQTIAVIGNIAGVLLLFIYGMPYRLRSPNGSPTFQWVESEAPDPKTVSDDVVHEKRSVLGLLLILGSAALQLISIWFF